MVAQVGRSANCLAADLRSRRADFSAVRAEGKGEWTSFQNYLLHTEKKCFPASRYFSVQLKCNNLKPSDHVRKEAHLALCLQPPGKLPCTCLVKMGLQKKDLKRRKEGLVYEFFLIKILAAHRSRETFQILCTFGHLTLFPESEGEKVSPSDISWGNLITLTMFGYEPSNI